MSQLTSTFFNTVNLLPKERRFDHGGAKLALCPGRHLTSLYPWQTGQLIEKVLQAALFFKKCEMNFFQHAFTLSQTETVFCRPFALNWNTNYSKTEHLFSLKAHKKYPRCISAFSAMGAHTHTTLVQRKWITCERVIRKAASLWVKAPTWFLSLCHNAWGLSTNDVTFFTNILYSLPRNMYKRTLQSSRTNFRHCGEIHAIHVSYDLLLSRCAKKHWMYGRRKVGACSPGFRKFQ